MACPERLRGNSKVAINLPTVRASAEGNCHIPRQPDHALLESGHQRNNIVPKREEEETTTTKTFGEKMSHEEEQNRRFFSVKQLLCDVNHLNRSSQSAEKQNCYSIATETSNQPHTSRAKIAFRPPCCKSNVSLSFVCLV